MTLKGKQNHYDVKFLKGCCLHDLSATQTRYVEGIWIILVNVGRIGKFDVSERKIDLDVGRKRWLVFKHKTAKTLHPVLI